jgi:hypothetical protein
MWLIGKPRVTMPPTMMPITRNKFNDDAGSAFLHYGQQISSDDLSKTTTLVPPPEKSSDPKYAKQLTGTVRRGSSLSLEIALTCGDIDNRESHTGITALSIAAELVNTQISELLLIHGATVNKGIGGGSKNKKYWSIYVNIQPKVAEDQEDLSYHHPTRSSQLSLSLYRPAL